MELDLRGKRALVCGSSQGIGKAAAIELALLGASVTLLARSPEALAEVLGHLDTSKGQSHEYLQGDLMQVDDVLSSLQEKLVDRPFHILVNNTGGPPAGPLISADPDHFLAALTRHLLAAHRITQSLVPGMAASGYGRIINVISTSVKAPLANLGVSNTTRGAVANWAKTLANELGPKGITVNNVLPGATATGRLNDIIGHAAKRTESSPEAVEERMKGGIPLRRFARPAEVGAAIAFLASPAAAYISGINLPVDGGRTPCL